MWNTQSDETCGLLELINYSIWLKTSTLRNLVRMFYRAQHRRAHLCVLFSVTLEGLPEAALTSRYQSNRQRAGIGQKRMTQLSSRILLFSLSLFLAIMSCRLSLFPCTTFQWQRCRGRHLEYCITNKRTGTIKNCGIIETGCSDMDDWWGCLILKQR